MSCYHLMFLLFILIHLDVIPDEDLVVDDELVVLQHAVEAGVGPLDVPHEPAQLGQSGGGWWSRDPLSTNQSSPAQLGPALPRLAVHVLRDVDVAPPQQARLPQHILLVPEVGRYCRCSAKLHKQVTLK